MELAFILITMNKNFILLDKLMDIAVLRHQVLANNLANVNTPGYQRQDVNFLDSLRGALSSGRASNIAAVKPEVVRDDSAEPARPDGNNISTQREMSELAQNELLYQLSTRVMSAHLNRLKSVLK